jgi:hypothetical protein
VEKEGGQRRFARAVNWPIKQEIHSERWLELDLLERMLINEMDGCRSKITILGLFTERPPCTGRSFKSVRGSREPCRIIIARLYDANCKSFPVYFYLTDEDDEGDALDELYGGLGLAMTNRRGSADCPEGLRPDIV